MSNELLPGQELHPGQTLISPRGEAVLVFQLNGDVVLYRGHGPYYQKDANIHVGVGYWHTGTAGQREITRAMMQTDGRFVLRDPRGNVKWGPNPQKVNPGAKLILQDDGNLVVYHGKNAVWSSETSGFPDRVHPQGGGFFDWAGNVVKTTGRAAGSAIHAVNDVTGSVTDVVKKVPILGTIYYAEWDLTVGGIFSLADKIASGERLDQAMMSSFKDRIHDIQEIAPYAETVIAFVPGIGPEVSAAIGCSLALAEGKTIDEALIAGVRAAIPGGAIVQAAFDVSVAAIKGESAAEIGLTALEGAATASGVQIPEQAKVVLKSGLAIAHSMARGERIDRAALEGVIVQLPSDMQQEARQAAAVVTGKKSLGDVLIEDAQLLAARGLNTAAQAGLRKALTVGMSMGNASHLQKVMKEKLGEKITNLAVKGANAAAKEGTKQASILVQKGVNAAVKEGFHVGLGLAHYNARGPQVVLATRAHLSADHKKGFDMALSYHMGRVTHTPPTRSPAVNTGFWITIGMRRHLVTSKVAILQTLRTMPQERQGALQAINLIYAHQTWWHRLWDAIFHPGRPKLMPKEQMVMLLRLQEIKRQETQNKLVAKGLQALKGRK